MLQEHEHSPSELKPVDPEEARQEEERLAGGAYHGLRRGREPRRTARLNSRQFDTLRPRPELESIADPSSPKPGGLPRHLVEESAAEEPETVHVWCSFCKQPSEVPKSSVPHICKDCGNELDVVGDEPIGYENYEPRSERELTPFLSGKQAGARKKYGKNKK